MEGPHGKVTPDCRADRWKTWGLAKSEKQDERAADADGANLSRVGRPEKYEMTAEADVAKIGVAPGTAAARFTERRTQTGHR